MAEPEVAGLMAQMLSATLHCHRRSVVHHDLKPENFLFREVPRAGSDHSCEQGGSDALKLIDFGFSVPRAPAKSGLATEGATGGTSSPGGTDGTILYMSPQALLGEASSPSDDVWSLGVVFHILLTGQFPFSTNDDDRFQELFARGQLAHDVQSRLRALSAEGGARSVSPAAADLASRLLAYEASERISVEEALQHPFLNGVQPGAPEMADAKEACERCARFLRACRLRRLAAVAVAHLVDEPVQARAAFLALDRAGDGLVTVSAIREYLRTTSGQVPPSLSVGATCGSSAEADLPGLGYTAFLAATLDETVLSGRQDLCRAAFDLLDADHDGILSAADLHHRLGVPLAECEQIIGEALSNISILPAQSSHQRPLAVAPACGDALAFPDFLNMMGSNKEVTVHELLAQRDATETNVVARF